MRNANILDLFACPPNSYHLRFNNFPVSISFNKFSLLIDILKWWMMCFGIYLFVFLCVMPYLYKLTILHGWNLYCIQINLNWTLSLVQINNELEIIISAFYCFFKNRTKKKHKEEQKDMYRWNIRFFIWIVLYLIQCWFIRFKRVAVILNYWYAYAEDRLFMVIRDLSFWLYMCAVIVFYKRKFQYIFWCI